ncbi:MAG: hypothetical protein Q9215_004729 [Flavoplaca cf. flavocitrina]
MYVFAIKTLIQNIPIPNLKPVTSKMTAARPLNRIPGLDGLAFGRLISPPTQAAINKVNQTAFGNSAKWRFQPGTYTTRQVVEHVAPLLNSLIAELGQDPPGAEPSRKILIDGLRSCLAISGRESTLPIGDAINMAGESARKVMAKQAQRIGSLLVRCAQNAPPPDVTVPQMTVRSPCEGHVWTREVAGLLIGPRSNGNLMQVYNEWLHQIVLLRDGLLPFENFDEVRLTIKQEGARPVDDIRSKFLMQIMTAQVKRTTVIDVAKALTASGLPSGGYGFQYGSGLVMPLSLFTGSSSILLKYVPATVDDSRHQELLFDYENKDYFSAPRHEISVDEVTSNASSISSTNSYSTTSNPVFSSFAIENPRETDSFSQIRHIKLQGSFEDGAQYSVDVGQITRGLRYVYRAVNTNCEDSSAEPSSFALHKASDVLSLPDLVTSTSRSDGVRLHVIQAGSAVARMALLGKLYPENVVLVNGEKQSPTSALGVGKGFGPQFVIIGGDVVG